MAVTIFMVALPSPARAAEAVEFIDMRPAVIDLDATQPNQRWQVPVIDGRPGRRHELFLTVAFHPAGVVRVKSPRVRLNEGGVGVFVLELSRREVGSGELILSSGGVIVRRPISTSHGPGRVALSISRLQFSGVRLMPFGDRVSIGDMTVPGAPAAATTTAPGRIGVLTSRHGDTAEVVRRGDTFGITGGTEPGEYQGALDLLPSRPGTEAEGILRIRDMPVWPLFVLIVGLSVVQFLDRYRRRERPRQMLDLHLARLRDRALVAQSTIDHAYRIVARPPEPDLLLDRLSAMARRRFDDDLSEAEGAAWDVDGAEYVKVMGSVESFETLAETVAALSAERSAAMTGSVPAHALDRSPVGRALRGRPLRSTVDLSEALAEVSAARAYLGEFRRLYGQAAELAAHDVLAKLRTGPESLAALDAEVAERYRSWDPGPVTEELTRVPGAYAHASVARDQHTAGPPAGKVQATTVNDVRAKRRRWPLLVAVAGALLLVPCAAMFYLTADGRDASPPGTAAPTASSIPSPTALPELPAAPEPQAPPAGRAVAARATTGQLVLYGTVLPLCLAGVALAGVTLVNRRRHPRRHRLDSESLDRRVRRSDRQFAVIGGALVVLSGMSVLYFANPTFGSPGDYLAMALWGTAFGEGITLARRLWPSPA